MNNRTIAVVSFFVIFFENFSILGKETTYRASATSALTRYGRWKPNPNLKGPVV
jgi:hypothetical protein